MLPTSVTPNISAGLGIGAQRFQLNNLLRSELNNQVSDLSYAAGAGLGGGIFGGLAGVVNSGVRGAALPAFGQQISAVQAAAPFLDAAAVQGGRGLANAQGVLNSVFPGAGVGLQAGNAGNVLQRVSASGFNSGNNFNVLSAILGLGGNGGGGGFGGGQVDLTRAILQNIFGNFNNGGKSTTTTTGAKTTQGTGVKQTTNANANATQVYTP